MKKFKLKINENSYDIEIKKAGDAQMDIEVNGNPYNVEITHAEKVVKTPVLVINPTVPSTDYHPSTAKTNAPKGGIIYSPLPGNIVEIFVKEGDYITHGQKLLVLEAMKMENNIDSDKEGKVTAIKIQPGDAVMEGDALIVIGE
ncbi:MAG: acetyl-CoA carboxylase biotin carboxyl carrier protein subunit [Bacteroidetes bacterium RIFOXYA12_FULL_35_11]|nr:MAG: acetyl-CoA carboxylase biotin carboxyl carrier protein subunit [Bacteroidetes bacterium GWF2_35_48]OFY73187.1 MAG: acetyl-CoA carboxylase biotin carboxyl carrier protein subunit [Bacteroidetes bacterium RIFOXYA12_FULL_35_11]OFY95075.1 MAG: acetyl-CoA carboxylase biotin carboxyl carrier protein subunit [Bacteroidetes bacterium RIFOXYB2_FULL_35_7]OFY99024.1 MAG: acetyl-CoA carboxylase biotin carboxyl carrier protein subunit [Bacteroidetes bacterium RIFOXYC12_FULL_35_7]HBX50724.1 acetyl-Co